MRPLLTLALFVAIAAPARAGTYEHHTLSAASPGLDGWTPRVASAGGFVAADVAADRLWLRFWARPWFGPGELADWIYTTAADTTLAGWEIQRTVTGVVAGDWNTLFDLVVDGRWQHAVYDVPSLVQPWAPVGGSGQGAEQLVARLACGGPSLCTGAASMELRAARMVLHDGHAQAVSGVQGELASERVLAGTAALSFAAADRGGGVYRAYAEVDGRAGVPVAVGDARCRDAIPGGDPYQFAHRRPCPLEASATVAVDTTPLAEGRHVVSVHVEDAAGNRTTVFGPAARTVDNVPEPPAPGPPAATTPPAATAPATTAPAPPNAPVVTAWLERRGRRTSAVTVPHGERVRLRGRVTDASGRPLPAAPVEIAELLIDGHGRPTAAPASTAARRSVRGAAAPSSTAARQSVRGAAAPSSTAARRPSWRPVTGVRTRADGRFTAFTRVGPSRRLRIVSDGALGPRLTVRVRAPLTVRASRRGRAVLVRGRVPGGHVPRDGALVELQARSGPRWTTRLVVRTWRSGRFTGRMEPVPAVRVRVPRQAGLPYATGLARARVQPSA